MSNLYIPPHAKNLKTVEFPQIRLGIQGDSGTGKTYGVVKSFPNVVVANFDNNLSRFAGSDVNVVNFCSDAWLAEYQKGKFKSKAAFPANIANVKDAFLDFVYNEATKFSEEQTFFVDSWSSLMDWWHNWFYRNPIQSKKGNEDSLAMWQDKIDYSSIVMTGLKALSCHVVVSFHEYKIRDEVSGQLTDKLAPLMSGSYRDQLKKHFTEFFRTIVLEDKDKDGKPTGDVRYCIQVKSDKKFDAVKRMGFNPKQTYFDVTEPDGSLWKFFQDNYFGEAKGN